MDLLKSIPARKLTLAFVEIRDLLCFVAPYPCRKTLTCGQCSADSLEITRMKLVWTCSLP